MNKELENNLRNLLKEQDYESFIKTITEIDINKENYKTYLDKIGLILNDYMKTEVYINPSSNSGDELLRLVKESEDLIQGKPKEKTPFEWYPDLKAAIVKIFKIKLEKDVTFRDNDAYLVNFEKGFIR